MKKYLQILIVVGVFIVVAILLTRQTLLVNIDKENLPHARLGGATIKVEIADTQDEQTLGLSGRESLPNGRGMLFVFQELSEHMFWMKDMKFPIDIIWLAENFKIVDVKENATPESYPDVFLPTEKARYVLEVQAGFFARHRLKLGDKVRIDGL